MRTRTEGARPLLVALIVALASAGAAGCFGRYAFIGIGTAVDVLPDGYVSVTVGTMPYYYHRGIFYQRYRRGFVVVPAPIGAMVMAPPPGYVMVMVENDPYHYYRGVFYAPTAGRYRVVRPPIGAFVRSLPESVSARTVGGVEYKEYAGTYYRPAIRDGRRGYEVTEAPTAPRLPRER